MAKSQDVETAENGTVSVKSPRPADMFRAYLLDRAQPAEGVSSLHEDIEADQLARILAAETEDEIWAADLGGTIATRDLVGCEVEIQGMNVFLSTNPDFETFLGVFATFPASAISVPEEVSRATGLKPGQDFVMSTGASSIIAKIRAFEAREMLPVKALVQGITTSRGNTVLKLSRPPSRAVPGTAE